MTAPKVPKLKLSNGFEIPVFGLGTWKSQPGEVTKTVQDAIDVGYRHIDGAFVYGNEKEVGSALQAKIKDGTVKREDLFITSKLWNTFHKPDLVVGALKKTLADLQLEYLDLYLIHWPFGFKEGDALFPSEADGKMLYSDADFVDTWKSMEECVNLGLAKSIGVSNFNSQQLQRVLDNSKIKPAVNQFECHPYLNQKKLAEFCKSKGVVVTGYSPLGSPDRPWAQPTDPKLLDDPKLVELGKKYKKSSAQVVLRWLIQRDIVTIPKTVHKERLIENLNLFDFTLSDDDMNYLYTFNKGEQGRVCRFGNAETHKDFPFSIEF